jgi:molybdopterin converting factor subunit 1
MAKVMVKVLFFAAAKEKVDKNEEIFTFDQTVTLGMLKQHIYARYTQLEKLAPYLRWAVNQSFVDDEQYVVLSDSEVAIIPPISGG